MEGHRRDGDIVVGDNARQRFHDARGYGRPTKGDEIVLDPVEAAHLLVRGDLESVDGEGFGPFVAAQDPDFGPRFIVYADLRARGFYLSPTRAGWTDRHAVDADFVVYERGAGPPDGAIAHAVAAIGERTDVPAESLGEGVLAVVDEEGEVTYLRTERTEPSGSSAVDLPAAEGQLLADRALVEDPPAALYGRGFFGQPLGAADDGPTRIQLSLVEAAYLARSGALTVDGGAEAVIERGRAVEGDRFDRRLATYTALRERGVVPKTGFKFGADFRTYESVESVETLGHSEALVRVLPRGYVFTPRELSLDVRLAAGVRKRTVFALTDGTGEVTWLAASRLTP